MKSARRPGRGSAGEWRIMELGIVQMTNKNCQATDLFIFPQNVVMLKLAAKYERVESDKKMNDCV
jgi:hypothetical protein